LIVSDVRSAQIKDFFNAWNQFSLSKSKGLKIPRQLIY